MEETKNASPTKKNTITPSSSSSQATGSSESFLGSMLVLFLILLLLGVTGFFGFFGYRVWKQSKIIKNTPSIDHLALDKVASPTVPEEKAEEKTTPPSDTTPSNPAPEIDKKTLEIKVLNGGAAKGTAGTFTETLKKTGYTKATFGNSVGDYVGVTIYYAKDKEALAETLKGDVAKTYPKVTLAPALAANKDTTTASLVVILGK